MTVSHERMRPAVHPAVHRRGVRLAHTRTQCAGSTAALSSSLGSLRASYLWLSVLGAIINTVHCALKVLMDVYTLQPKQASVQGS